MGQSTAVPQMVPVTVSAGISNDSNSGNGTNRSAVVTEGTTRKLKFTTGDRIYVWDRITSTADSPQEKFLVGYLNMVGSPNAEGISAAFSGSLSVYVWETEGNFSLSTYEFTTDDPLSECEHFNLYSYLLVPKDAVPYIDTDKDYQCYLAGIADTIDELLLGKMELCGTYDKENKRFNFSTDMSGKFTSATPILHVNITGGLTSGATYDISFCWGSSITDDLGDVIGSKVAKADGSMEFFFAPVVGVTETFYFLKFINTEDDTDEKIVVLGNKALQSKIYNITRGC